MPSTTDVTTTPHQTAAPWRTIARTRVGVGMLGLSLLGWTAWLGWRLAAIPLEPRVATVVSGLVLALELLGVLIGAIVGWGLMTATAPRHDHAGDDDHDVSHRFAHVVADAVGRTRAEDLHHDVRLAARAAARVTPVVRRHSMADWVIASVLADAPRRLAMVSVITFALLLGVSPMSAPPLPALAALCVAVGAMSAAHMMLSGNRIAVGDRLRWSYSSLGEIVVREDLAGVAPRRWVGTVATVVALDLALALRGISDRWTHGLPGMDGDQRKVVMVIALMLVLGALFTLVTTPAPQLDNAHLVARRLEERTARQSLLAMVMIAGVVGLLAGLFTGDVDSADDDSVGIEEGVERETRAVVVA